MGALTDHRKRWFVDLCLPFSSHSLCGSSSSTAPPAKKPRLQFSPSTPDRAAPPPPPQPQPLYSLRTSPQPSPLPRPLHGPQRILKAFGLGSVRRTPLEWVSRTERSFQMGSFISKFFQQKKAALSSLSSRRKGDVSVSESGSHERLGLKEYKRLVGSQEEHSAVVSDSTSYNILIC